MAKATILITEKEIRIIGAWQCSNGLPWDAEGCFKYCNSDKSPEWDEHQAEKLSWASGTLALHGGCGKKDWYKDRTNFIDAEVGYDCDQAYHWPDLEEEKDNGSICF